MTTRRNIASVRRRRVSVAVMAALFVGTASGYGYTLVQVLPASHYGSVETLAVTVAFGVGGVAYAVWAAVLNRSVIIGVLGPSEIFLAALLGFVLVRMIRSANSGLSLVLAAVGTIAFLYPWFNAGVVLRRLRRWTGFV